MEVMKCYVCHSNLDSHADTIFYVSFVDADQQFVFTVNGAEKSVALTKDDLLCHACVDSARINMKFYDSALTWAYDYGLALLDPLEPRWPGMEFDYKQSPQSGEQGTEEAERKADEISNNSLILAASLEALNLLESDYASEVSEGQQHLSEGNMNGMTGSDNEDINKEETRE